MRPWLTKIEINTTKSYDGFFPSKTWGGGEGERERGLERRNIPMNYGNEGHAHGFEHILIEVELSFGLWIGEFRDLLLWRACDLVVQILCLTCCLGSPTPLNKVSISMRS